MYNATKRKPDKRLNWIFNNINGIINALAPSMTQKSNFLKKEDSSSYRPNIQRDTFLEGSTNDNREFLP